MTMPRTVNASANISPVNAYLGRDHLDVLLETTEWQLQLCAYSSGEPIGKSWDEPYGFTLFPRFLREG